MKRKDRSTASIKPTALLPAAIGVQTKIVTPMLPVVDYSKYDTPRWLRK